MQSKEAKPIVVKEKEAKIIKQQRVPLTKPLIIPDKEDIAKVESKAPVNIENNTDANDELKAVDKVALTAPLVIEEREDIELIAPKTEIAEIEIAEADEIVKPMEKIALTNPLVIEDREEISEVLIPKSAQVLPEDSLTVFPVKDNKVALTPPLEIPEQEIAVRDSAPELIKKDVEMVIITESDNDLQIAVSPAQPLTAPKYDEPTINEVSANYMTFKHNSTAVDQIQVIDIVEPVYDSLWFNNNYQVTLVADSRDKQQLSLPRLKAVQNVLIKKGVAKDRIKLVLKDDELNTATDNYSGAVYLKVQSVK